MLHKAARYLLLFLLAGVIMSYTMPKGWRAGGTFSQAYEMGIDPDAPNGKNVATIRSLKKEVGGFGTMTQAFSSDHYKGKRLKLSGYLRTKDVASWAGLVLKIEGKVINPHTGIETNKILAYDNMYNRLVSGTTDFTRYEIVLDVPDTSSSIVYGARLTGGGQIWFDRLKLEIVGKDVPLTSPELQEPTNIDFSE